MTKEAARKKLDREYKLLNLWRLMYVKLRIAHAPVAAIKECTGELENVKKRIAQLQRIAL